MVKNDPAIYKIPSPAGLIGSHLFESDFYHIKNWAFDRVGDHRLTQGYNDCFCLIFVKKGYYFFDQHRKHDMRTGHLILEKGGYEYSLRPATGECTIINFTDTFYKQFVEDMNLQNVSFFSNPNIISQVLLASPEIEYLHFQLLKQCGNSGKLEMDNLVLELLYQTVDGFTRDPLRDELLPAHLTYHLAMIEQAKNYINENFRNDVSLYEISRYCCVSPFHFSRIFKKITTFSPYQYLYNIRLKHGEMLLKNSTILISEIALSCGFCSVEHFATAFKQRYQVSPTLYRKQ